MQTLLEKYNNVVVPAMQEEFGFKNRMAVPKILKVTLNSGIGKFLKDPKVVDDIERDLARISGQKPVRTKAKKAIASFKTRENMEIGIKVTLRGMRMWDFLERFIGAALPRTRDFRGISQKAFDREGNLAIGIKEQMVFPEASGDDVKTIFGFQAIVTLNAKKQEEGIRLIKLLGFPIAKDK